MSSNPSCLCRALNPQSLSARNLQKNKMRIKKNDMNIVPRISRSQNKTEKDEASVGQTLCYSGPGLGNGQLCLRVHPPRAVRPTCLLNVVSVLLSLGQWEHFSALSGLGATVVPLFHSKRALSSALSRYTCQLGPVKLFRINVPCYISCHVHARITVPAWVSFSADEHGCISATHPRQRFYCYCSLWLQSSTDIRGLSFGLAKLHDKHSLKMVDKDVLLRSGCWQYRMCRSWHINLLGFETQEFIVLVCEAQRYTS